MKSANLPVACSYMLTRHDIYVFMHSMHNTRNNAILLTNKYHLNLKWWSWVCVIVLITSYWFAVVTKTHLVWFRRYTPVYRSGIIICVLYFEYRIIPSCILHIASCMEAHYHLFYNEVHNCNYFHLKNVCKCYCNKSLSGSSYTTFLFTARQRSLREW